MKIDIDFVGVWYGFLSTSYETFSSSLQGYSLVCRQCPPFYISVYNVEHLHSSVQAGSGTA